MIICWRFLEGRPTDSHSDCGDHEREQRHLALCNSGLNLLICSSLACISWSHALPVRRLGRRGLRHWDRTGQQLGVDEAILFQRLMQNWLSSFVKLLTTKLGAHIGDLAGDLLAAERSFFQPCAICR